MAGGNSVELDMLNYWLAYNHNQPCFLFWLKLITGIYLQSFTASGGLAHLVERKHGMFEVTGSIPVSSTKAAHSKFFGAVPFLFSPITN